MPRGIRPERVQSVTITANGRRGVRVEVPEHFEGLYTAQVLLRKEERKVLYKLQVGEVECVGAVQDIDSVRIPSRQWSVMRGARKGNRRIIDKHTLDDTPEASP